MAKRWVQRMSSIDQGFHDEIREPLQEETLAGSVSDISSLEQRPHPQRGEQRIKFVHFSKPPKPRDARHSDSKSNGLGNTNSPQNAVVTTWRSEDEAPFLSTEIAVTEAIDSSKLAEPHQGLGRKSSHTQLSVTADIVTLDLRSSKRWSQLDSETLGQIPHATNQNRENSSDVPLAHPELDSDQVSVGAKSSNNKLRKTSSKGKARKPDSQMKTTRVTKSHQRPGRHLELNWRVGQAPSAQPSATQEEIHLNHVFSVTSQFYQGNAGLLWRQILSQNPSQFNHDNGPLSFVCSTVVVAGLITAGRSAQAHQTLQALQPLARAVLLSQHPMIYSFLVDLAMDTSLTLLGKLRASLAQRLAGIASDTLGGQHPIALLFKIPLTLQQRKQMRIDLQAKIHEELVQVFGPYSYQTIVHYGYFSRTVANCGNPEEALSMLTKVIPLLELTYGINSKLATIGILEQARTELLLGSSSVKLECMLADCLRRLDILTQANSSDSRLLNDQEIPKDGLPFMRISALRMLGRVHMMRRNFVAALYCFEQVLLVAGPVLKRDGATMRICTADLEVARRLEKDQANGQIIVEDPASQLSDLVTITHFVLFDF